MMEFEGISMQWLEDSKRKYMEARRLIDEESLRDPVSEPYKSKYAAKEILSSLKCDIECFFKHDVSKIDDTFEVKEKSSRAAFLYALIHFDLGVLAIDTEELNVGEEYLGKCTQLLRQFSQRHETLLIFVSSLNSLGVLWAGRNEQNKACEYLKEAERVFASYKKENKALPADFCDFFEPELKGSREGELKIEKAHTHTLYYLAQVYEHLGESERAAMYCHSTLKRQVESGDYDPVDWALNSATLAQFFIARDNFLPARHLLACSSYVISKYECELNSKLFTPEEMDGKLEELRHRKADVARCWAKYGLVLLISSQDFLSGNHDDLATTNTLKSETHSRDQPYLLFRNQEVKDYEKDIPYSPVANYEEARLVFLNTQKWLNEAKGYYTVEDHASDYVQVIQEMSKLFKSLSAFETSPERQCRMHKRRIDLLEECLKALNPQYYLLVCRQLMFELGETYSEMMDIKLQLFTSHCSNEAHAVKKINYLGEKAIEHFKSFLCTLNGSDQKLPESLADDVVRPALIAHFYLGRLYSKLVFMDHREQLEALSESETNYKFIVDYVKRNPSHRDVVSQEIQAIEEMLQLIPGKMQNIMSSTLYP
ncbi:KIF-binding protein [Tachypleus tridentatus]|uniref:KIF-binding protein n=1 Tax=Tachypleus tridentatus TaxID=6853 RepID=UPI003FD3BF15